MAKCGYCSTTILFGGVKDSSLTYCNQECHQKGQVLVLSRSIPNDAIADQVRQIHRGACPKCSGSGPVDVHTSYRIYSALLYSSWSSVPNISCRSCGIKSQIGNTLFSAVLGWWGFPWGLIMTPVQIGRNLFGMLKGPDESKPSSELENLVRVSIASQALQQQGAATAAQR